MQDRLDALAAEHDLASMKRKIGRMLAAVDLECFTSKLAREALETKLGVSLQPHRKAIDALVLECLEDRENGALQQQRAAAESAAPQVCEPAPAPEEGVAQESGDGRSGSDGEEASDLEDDESEDDSRQSRKKKKAVKSSSAKARSRSSAAQNGSSSSRVCCTVKYELRFKLLD